MLASCMPAMEHTPSTRPQNEQSMHALAHQDNTVRPTTCNPKCLELSYHMCPTLAAMLASQGRSPATRVVVAGHCWSHPPPPQLAPQLLACWSSCSASTPDLPTPCLSTSPLRSAVDC